MHILTRPPGRAVVPPYPRARFDPELLASLAPLAEDHLARLRTDRERHGPAAATILAASRLAKYYGWVHLVCEGAVDAARREGRL